MWCWGGGHLILSTEIECHNRYTVGGEVELLHNDHGVLYVPVQEVYAETRPRLRPHLTPLYWAVPHPHLAWKVNPIRLWLYHRGGGIPMSSQANTILCLVVGCNKTHSQVQSKLWALNLQPLMGLVGDSLSCHPPLVGRL